MYTFVRNSHLDMRSKRNCQADLEAEGEALHCGAVGGSREKGVGHLEAIQASRLRDDKCGESGS